MHSNIDGCDDFFLYFGITFMNSVEYSSVYILNWGMFCENIFCKSWTLLGINT